MKVAIWMIFGLVALVWTGGAFLASELTRWMGHALASGQAASLGQEMAQWPVPQWLSLWTDPALIQSMQPSVLWAVEALHDALPLLGSAAGWLGPVVWGLWGLGLMAVFVLACGAHVLLGRLQPARARSA